MSERIVALIILTVLAYALAVVVAWPELRRIARELRETLRAGKAS